MMGNRIISVERILQYMNIPSELPLVIESNRPDSHWPAQGEVDILYLQISLSCVFEERRALLDFKAFINESHHPHLILPSWIDYHQEQGYNDHSNTDCCNWERVKCSDSTGRIVQLHLRDLGKNIFANSGIRYDQPSWSLNLSILLPLKDLQILDLSDNFFGSSGLVPCERLAGFKNLESLNLESNYLDNNTTLQCLAAISSLKDLSLVDNRMSSLEGCERLTNFKNLEFLNLHGNFFADNNTIKCLSVISSIKHLSLSTNYFEGLFPLEEINSMKQLEYLDLGFNSFHGILSFKDLKLPHLQFLNLESTYMTEMSSIEAMISLKALSLRNIGINDSSILQGICGLKNLAELDLSGNDFSGNIPLCFANLTSLKALDISYNNFSGNIPSLVISKLINLEYLSISGNYFKGSFPLSSFANHSKLQVFILEPLGSELYFKTDQGPAFLPSFQLRVLKLAGCHLNNEPWQVVQKFLLYQKELRAIDLSSNNLVGEFPNWLLENNTRLEFLKLRNNSFTGPFLLDGTPKLQDLRMLDISNNEVDGQIPQDIGLFLSSLEILDLSRNHFEGSIPESFGNLTAASFIDLSHNNFSGEVPDRIGTGCGQLQVLLLSNNSLRGYFPSTSTNLTLLNTLHIDNNQFGGSISNGLSRSHRLDFLDISNNKFQGEIPSWIGNFSLLRALGMSRNQLQGTIPSDICKLSSLEFFDFSENHLNGSIPSCSTLPSLKSIHLQRNQITGSIPYALLETSRLLRTLDLRYNHISGAIPSDIGTFTQLVVMLLGGNNLQGKIPASMCQMKELTMVDLSQNNFSGEIPPCLSNLSFGANLDYGIGIQQTTLFWGLNNLYNGSLSIYPYVIDYNFASKLQEMVEFTTKSITSHYEGRILNYMSGLDLSFNQLTGQIPSELGDLSNIRALNLSHNYLYGSIPSRLSLLNLIESLDLSYNHLSGQIPYELTNLNFLSNFNVSYNNLSGRAPEKGQFATFDESNYRGNPSLCIPLLHIHCERNTSTVDPMHDVGDEVNDGEIDKVAFLWSFSASFVAVLATLAVSLYLSSRYRRALSDFIDAWILSRFYRGCKSHPK